MFRDNLFKKKMFDVQNHPTDLLLKHIKHCDLITKGTMHFPAWTHLCTCDILLHVFCISRPENFISRTQVKPGIYSSLIHDTG